MAASESLETTPLPWYSKCYEYLKNRNRISPGHIVIPNSEFFSTGPRRNLRILRPPLRCTVYYENTNHDRPQSVNDNFFSRWSRRPHPSGNCRCSYRRSGRLSRTDEQLISNEIQRIRTSLCEAESTGQEISEIEQSVCLNLESLRASSPGEDQATKEKIVHDLDKYINDLLDEILNDTVQILTGLDRSFQGSHRRTTLPSRSVQTQAGKGYVNAGFIGSDCDPDALNFHCHSVSESAGDCVDSGINSVDTVELETDPPSLEQSLMAIIDSKLGKSPLDKSLEDLSMEIAEFGERNGEDPEGQRIRDHGQSNGVEVVQGKVNLGRKTGGNDADKDSELENHEHSFEKTRLEFADEEGATCTRNVAAKMNRTVSALREKLVTSLGSRKSQENRDKLSREKTPAQVELGLVKRRREGNIGGPVHHSVTLRKNRKPTIVFLHGFGSSAEIFEHQLRYFTELGYPCIAPDMLGHGFSSAPRKARDYHFERLLKDVDSILNEYALRPGQRCVLVGHNYGCSLATSLAAKYESQISQLILISGGGPIPLAPPSSEGIGHYFLRAMLAPLLVCGLHRDILYSARGRQHPYCGPGERDQWPSHMKHVLRGMVWPGGDYAFHRRICTPTLLIHGLRDNSVSLVQECQMERTMIKALLEAIPTAGHTPMTDCPDQLNHMIHCFIDLWKNKR